LVSYCVIKIDKYLHCVSGVRVKESCVENITHFLAKFLSNTINFKASMYAAYPLCDSIGDLYVTPL